MTHDPADVAALAAAYTAAWNTGDPNQVAAHFADDGEIIINRGTPWRGRAGVAAMAAGFFADVPDIRLTCEGVHCAGLHVLYLWTFTGHAVNAGHALAVHGWEEWDLTADLQVQASRGWFDADDYARQVAGAKA